jgi:hypothetical protein
MTLWFAEVRGACRCRGLSIRSSRCAERRSNLVLTGSRNRKGLYHTSPLDHPKRLNSPHATRIPNFRERSARTTICDCPCHRQAEPSSCAILSATQDRVKVLRYEEILFCVTAHMLHELLVLRLRPEILQQYRQEDQALKFGSPQGFPCQPQISKLLIRLVAVERGENHSCADSPKLRDDLPELRRVTDEPPLVTSFRQQPTNTRLPLAFVYHRKMSDSLLKCEFPEPLGTRTHVYREPNTIRQALDALLNFYRVPISIANPIESPVGSLEPMLAQYRLDASHNALE